MEQKKTLWIVAASGVFLLVVAGAALLLSFQKTGTSQTYSNPADGWVSSAKVPDSSIFAENNQALNSSPQTAEQDAVQPLPQSDANTIAQTGFEPQNQFAQNTSLQNESATPNENPINAKNVTVITDSALVYGTGTTTTIDLNALKTNPNAVSQVTPKNTYTADQINENNRSEKSEKSSAPQAKTESKPKTVAKTTAVSKTLPKKETPAKTVTATAKTSSKTAKSAKTTAQKPVSYWIQVGSYEAKKSADEARTSLENNKIPNEVFTYNDAKGKLFYRVRVGPYTTKSEAEYWQKRIASTNEFAKVNSYIVQN